MRSHARVVVIGGGAVGASCLYHLTIAGVEDCVLIEKDELTAGSTWHAAGNIPTYATTWLGMRAGNYAWSLYKDLGEKVDSAITYRHTGAFWPAHSQDRMDLFQHLVGVSKSAGFDLRMLSPSELQAMHPYYTAGESVIGAIFDPYEGDIDPSQLTQALAKGARDNGGEVIRFTRVTDINRSTAGEWQVHTTEGTITCEVVVNASGFYGGSVSRLVQQHLPVVTLEHQYLVTESLPELSADTDLFPLVRDPDICFYLRREGAGLLFGSYGHPGRPAFLSGVPNDFAHQLFPDSVEDIAEVMEQAIEHVPLLARAGIQRFVNGPIAYTPDAQPLCGPALSLPNFYHACGIQIGITHSAAVGKSIAEWVTEGETEWDLSAWDPRRFGDWATQDYATGRVTELYSLQYAIAFPHRLLTSGRPLQNTPLYDTLAGKGAVFGQVGGWERALWFDAENGYDESRLSFRDAEPWRPCVKAECEAVRDCVGLMDHGGFSKYEVNGRDAGTFLERVFCGRIPRVGRVKLSYMLTPKGYLWSEATIARLAQDRFLLCGPTVTVDRDFDWLTRHVRLSDQVSVKQGTARDAALMIMGPASRTLLSRVCDNNLSRDVMPWMSVSELTVAGRQVTAMRVSYVGELGWELHLASNDLAEVYRALLSAGGDLGLRDFGSYALNAMRLEKGYHAWGNDFGSEYTVFDAGLERFVDLAKTDFIGKQAILRQQQSESHWCFAGFIVESADADPNASSPIFKDGQLAGYVTSGGMGFRVDKRLALGYIFRRYAECDDEFHIEILGQSCRAYRTAAPFYDPENTRLRL